MGSIRVQAALLCAAFSFVAAVSEGRAEEPFYKGKRLTVLVNYAAGGPTDIEGRLFAKHIAKHIEGQPLLVVQNKDGASGLVGTNYLGEVAPRDGTMVGYLTGAAWQYVADPERHKVDLKNYEYVAFQPGTTIYYARADTPPGIKKPEDFMKVTQLVVGGLGIDSPKDLLNRLELDLLGVKFKYVTGYSSSQTARLALLRNEINMYSESVPTYKTAVAPLVQKGEVFALWYDPAYDGKTLGVPRQVEGLPIPAFHDYFRAQKGTMPSGILWDVTRTILSVNTAMQRLDRDAAGRAHGCRERPARGGGGAQRRQGLRSGGRERCSASCPSILPSPTPTSGSAMRSTRRRRSAPSSPSTSRSVHK